MAVALKGGEVPSGIECIAERAGRLTLLVYTILAVLRDGQGQIVGGFNLLMDITDRMNAEIETNEQFRAIVETTPECVKIVTAERNIAFHESAGAGDGGRAFGRRCDWQECL